MQSLLRRLKLHKLSSPRRIESLRLQGIESLDGFKPIYSRSPPWWARFTYTLVCADLILTVSAAELLWNHWTQLKEVQDDATPAASNEMIASSSDHSSVLPSSDEYVLRPIWQRGPLAAAHFAVGIGIAVMLLAARSRVVRRLYIIPSSSLARAKGLHQASAPNPNGRVVVMQAVHHFKSQGKVHPIETCKLERGRDDTELEIDVSGFKGRYYLGLQGAEADGRGTSVWDARKKIYDAWYGKDGAKIMARQGWVSGPVIEG